MPVEHGKHQAHRKALATVLDEMSTHVVTDGCVLLSTLLNVYKDKLEALGHPSADYKPSALQPKVIRETSHFFVKLPDSDGIFFGEHLSASQIVACMWQCIPRLLGAQLHASVNKAHAKASALPFPPS